MTSDNGGLSSEQITELALDKIVRVSQDAPPQSVIKLKHSRKKYVLSSILRRIDTKRREGYNLPDVVHGWASRYRRPC